MENENIDKEKIIEEMRNLRNTRQAKIEEFNKAHRNKEGVALSEIILHEVKYLGKMEFTVEGKEELVRQLLQLSCIHFFGLALLFLLL